MIQDSQRRIFKSDKPPSSDLHRWPNGGTLAVSFVVNVEEGAELSIGDGDERNESVYEVREEVTDVPDLCMESHFAYGPRSGYQRIVDLFEQFGVSATISTSGRSAVRLPWLLQDAVDNGHEISAHGWRWERHAGMDRESEKDIIARTYSSIKEACGIGPVGWHTRSSASIHTRELVSLHGGFAYDSDAYDDDFPRHEKILDNDHTILPYAFDTNDMRFGPGGGFVQPEDFSRYVLAAFDQLLLESSQTLRMISIGLHLRVIGRPARIVGLRQVLEHIARADSVWIAPRRDIASAARQLAGLPQWQARSAS